MFLVQLEKSFWKLVKLWAIIDVSVLVLFLSFAMSIVNWTKSNGIDMVVLVSYLPFAILPWLLNSVIPETAGSAFLAYIGLRDKLCGSGLGSTVGLWMIVSVFAAVQSLLLITLSRCIRKKVNP